MSILHSADILQQADQPLPPVFADLMTARDIVDHVEHLKQQQSKENSGTDFFCIKSANQWIKEAKTSPIPQMLFAELWHQGEICILFADSNLGKSILAVQIANSISRGRMIEGFKLETKKQTILYFDFELSAKQFEARYSEKDEVRQVFRNHYYFDENFIRIEFNIDAETPAEFTFEDYFYQSLEQAITSTNSKILIIDNITYLKNETEKAKDALPLMQYLKSLKTKYGLSILILAHTPKRDLSRPITQNDLGGSKMLYNFADSCFAIGQSHKDSNSRYIKQIKARNTAILYDSENVVVCQIQKPINFLEFAFVGFGTEREHLKELTEKDRESLIEMAKELRKNGSSQRSISAQLKIGVGTVNKYLNM